MLSPSQKHCYCHRRNAALKPEGKASLSFCALMLLGGRKGVDPKSTAKSLLLGTGTGLTQNNSGKIGWLNKPYV